MTKDNISRHDVTDPQISPRALLARIALADHLPVPRRIRMVADAGFRDLRLEFDLVAEARAWISEVGADPGTAKRRTIDLRGRPTLYYHSGYPIATWHGWAVEIEAFEPAPHDLDEAITARLATVADGGDLRTT